MPGGLPATAVMATTSGSVVTECAFFGVFGSFTAWVLLAWARGIRQARGGSASARRLVIETVGWPVLRIARRRRLARRRVAIRGLLAEAAMDDASLDPATVESLAAELFQRVQNAWGDANLGALQRLLGPGLFRAWSERLDQLRREGLHERVEMRSVPAVHVVAVERGRTADDARVVVWLSIVVRTWQVTHAGVVRHRPGSVLRRRRVREFWTLGRRRDRDGWRVLSIEADGEGQHHLRGDAGAIGRADDALLRDEAVLELAAADAAAGSRAAEIAPIELDADARRAALEIAAVDGRYDPAVLEASVRRIAAAWVQAVDGTDAPLAAVANARTVRDLLRPNGEHSRAVIRDAQVRRMSIDHLDVDCEPPHLSTSVVIRGYRYVEHRDTGAVVEGDRLTESETVEQWTLALGDDPGVPWRLVETGRRRP